MFTITDFTSERFNSFETIARSVNRISAREVSIFVRRNGSAEASSASPPAPHRLARASPGAVSNQYCPPLRSTTSRSDAYAGALSCDDSV